MHWRMADGWLGNSELKDVRGRIDAWLSKL